MYTSQKHVKPRKFQWKNQKTNKQKNQTQNDIFGKMQMLCEVTQPNQEVGEIFHTPILHFLPFKNGSRVIQKQAK